MAEYLCGRIFNGIESLRQPDITRPLKARAVSELLRTLREEGGVSHLKTTVPTELRSLLLLLSTAAPPLPCETAGDLCWSSDRPRDLCAAGEMYYMRNVMEISQLRTQINTTISSDVTQREAHHMLALSENLFALTVKLRCAVGASLQDYRELRKALDTLDTRCAVLKAFTKSSSNSR